MTKKEKRRKLLGALLILTVLVLVDILVHKAEFHEDTEEEAAVLEALSVEPETISAVKLQNSYGTLIFSYNGETWKSEEDPDIVLNQSSMRTLFERLHPLYAYRDLGTRTEPLEAYGLEEPQITIAIALDSGEEIYIYLGNEASDGNLYFMTSQSSHVYTGDAYLAAAFDCALSDLEDASEEETEES